MPHKCSVHGCDRDADYAVIFYDVYPHSDVDVFYQLHESVPYICQQHLNENEAGAENGSEDPKVRKYRGHVRYPHTPSGGQGFVIYRPLSS